MQIEEIREGSRATLLLSGRLTVNDGPGELKDAATALAADGMTDVVVDLAGVRYIDSACLGEFIASQITLARRGARLRLTNVPDRIMELLRLAGLDGIFEIAES
jgi:anti-sigma B factor antagonist